MIKLLIILFAAAATTTAVYAVGADHQGPERIVEGKYAVTLSIVPEVDGSLTFKFFFNDAETGQKVSDVSPIVSISAQSGEKVIDRKPLAVENGVAGFNYAFSASGLYDISMEFYQNSDPQKIYTPEQWSVWLPGKSGAPIGSSYQIGLSEIAGFSLAGLAVVLVTWSFVRNRQKARSQI